MGLKSITTLYVERVFRAGGADRHLLPFFVIREVLLHAFHIT